ncbi:MAG: nucleoside phosphorylase [Thermodesulfobacteriota bacterium]
MRDDFFLQASSSEGNEPYPRLAVLAFTRQELKIIRSLKGGGREMKPLLGGMTSVTFWPDLVLAGPMIGAPQAAMVMEILFRRGVSSFISLGWCGSLQERLRWGDIVLPDAALSEEGTSAHYPLADGQARPDEELKSRLASALESLGGRYTAGPVWTTDAPYRETKAVIQKHAAAGLLAVDMETSALMTVARFRRLVWAGLLVVSDELWGPSWRPGFESDELTAGLTAAAQAIMKLHQHGA